MTNEGKPLALPRHRPRAENPAFFTGCITYQCPTYDWAAYARSTARLRTSASGIGATGFIRAPMAPRHVCLSPPFSSFIRSQASSFKLQDLQLRPQPSYDREVGTDLIPAQNGCPDLRFNTKIQPRWSTRSPFARPDIIMPER